MERKTTTGAVVFHCSCGITEKGTPYDSRISGAVLGASETKGMFHRLIQTSAHDRVDMTVRRYCAKCGLDYMTQIRVGESQSIIYKCKCGNEETSGASASTTG